MNTSQKPLADLGRQLNLLGVLGVSLALLIAFYYQLALRELPCPLCLLQRAGLIMVGLAFMLNVRFGERGRHYAMALIGAVVTGGIALRQVLLHIVPGTGAYGSAVFGVHFYTLAWVSSVATVLYVAVLLLRFRRESAPLVAGQGGWTVRLALGLFVALIAANLVSTLLECGTGQCADDPVVYEWLQR